MAYRIVTTIGPHNVTKIVKAMKNNPIANSASLVLTEDNDDETKDSNQNDKTLRQAINLLTLCKWQKLNLDIKQNLNDWFKVEKHWLLFALFFSRW